MQDGRLAILIKADHESAEHERQTLLHEMCHVATWGVEVYHGENWQAEMRRLATEHGEAWVERDLVNYVMPDHLPAIVLPWRDIVLDGLDAIAQDFARMRWPRVRAFLAKDFQVDPAMLDRTIPEAAATWRKLAREARALRRQPRALALVAAVVLLAACALPASAQTTRVDLYDLNSRRTGSVTIDERTGRVDTYDARSNRTGYGQVDPRTGTVELFDLRGNRTGSGTLTRSGGSIREERR